MSPDTQMGGDSRSFPTTRPSFVARMGSAHAVERERAAEVLVRAYWKPVYKYARLRLRMQNEDAKDLTQAFFAQALEKDWLARFDPGKGSFRAFLRLSLEGFAANEEKARQRIKRGGGAAALPLDFETAEGELAGLEPPSSESVEAWFEREWRRELFAAVLAELERALVASGHALRLELFRRYDVEGESHHERPTYADRARAGSRVTAVTNHPPPARREFRRLLMERLREETLDEGLPPRAARSARDGSAETLSNGALAAARLARPAARAAGGPLRDPRSRRRRRDGHRAPRGDRALDRIVAIKIVHESREPGLLAEELRREAQTVARLEHPSIPPVHEIGELADGRAYYVMRFVVGTTLARVGSGSTNAGLRLFLRLCETVAYAHERGVVHRDLKPENVMLGPLGELYVMDWGIAAALEAHAGGGSASAIHAGTPGFMAPEQAGLVDAPIGPEADVFALGGILAFLATGRMPSPSGALDSSSVPRPLAAILSRSRAPRLEDRYPSALELARDVEAYLDREPVSAHREGLLERTGRLLGKHAFVAWLVLGYLTLRALILFLYQR
jgi:serine/threonine protein kinase